RFASVEVYISRLTDNSSSVIGVTTDETYKFEWRVGTELGHGLCARQDARVGYRGGASTRGKWEVWINARACSLVVKGSVLAAGLHLLVDYNGAGQKNRCR